jgi:Cytochrome P460/Haem-binding domain
VFAPIRIVLRVSGILLVGLVALQFVRPSLQNHPTAAELQVPPEVKQILKTSCYDCHSNETKLAWFDWPVPAYWLVIKDVREGRKHLNFSEIGKLPAGQQRAAFYESLSQIELGAMPLGPYKRLHSGTAVTPEQILMLKKYLGPQTPTAPADGSAIAAANAEFENWIPTGNDLSTNVSPAPNGIAFLPGYKNWTPISSTNRFDNHTIRQILGNDVAVKAIAGNQINPWPDGAAFAKVAWEQLADESGVIHPGKFYQVEFMIRDSKKYSSTLGWGWARWRGTQLKPYGANANFAKECVGCHSPLKPTDYVFTEPISISQRGRQ